MERFSQEYHYDEDAQASNVIAAQEASLGALPRQIYTTDQEWNKFRNHPDHAQFLRSKTEIQWKADRCACQKLKSLVDRLSLTGRTTVTVTYATI